MFEVDDSQHFGTFFSIRHNVGHVYQCQAGRDPFVGARFELSEESHDKTPDSQSRALRGSAKSHSEAHLLYERVFGRMADDAFCVTVQPGPEDLVPNSPVELVRVCQDAISFGRPLARHSPRRKPMSNCINSA